MSPTTVHRPAVVIGTVGLLGLFQKWRADWRNSIWQRIEWAIDLTLSGDKPKQELGLTRPRALGKRSFVRGDDRLAIDEAADRLERDARVQLFL